MIGNKICNRQSQSFCLSFKGIFRSKKLFVLDVIVIVIGNFVIVNPLPSGDGGLGCVDTDRIVPNKAVQCRPRRAVGL